MKNEELRIIIPKEIRKTDERSESRDLRSQASREEADHAEQGKGKQAQRRMAKRRSDTQFLILDSSFFIFNFYLCPPDRKTGDVERFD
ncbi:MAG: hypothetical protein NC209_02405 [Alistipes sp.]|nr:hypothetical protein [Alistipes senegalensis]MCM1249981.1 hypothetical protein [Alistipes sp.]